MSNTTKVTLGMSNISNLFQMYIRLPEYQRAYEWSEYHVKNLIDDTYYHNRLSDYLMGTIILHNNNDKFEIVDGQQRLVTLSILLYCLDSDQKNYFVNQEIFDNKRSFFNIQKTYKKCKEFVDRCSVEQKKNYLKFLLDHVIFSVLKVSGPNALDLAYTFFDSVNSKGKGLSDYDLLKAHHLMFIPEEQESLARKHNDFWISKDNDDNSTNSNGHHLLFSEILRRIRMWGRGENRDNKGDRSVFYEFISAIAPSDIEKKEHHFNKYMQPNVFRSWHRENDCVIINMKYPQQNIEDLLPMEIPQTIEGGDSFFLYAKRYHKIFDLLFPERLNDNDERSTNVRYTSHLCRSIENQYISTSFKACILLFYDKFGEDRLIEVATCIELILSQIRFKKGIEKPSPVRIESVLTKVKDDQIIPVILNSTMVSHVVYQLNDKITMGERNANVNNKNSTTLSRYLESIQIFYRKNLHMIKNNILIEKVKNIYLYEQK